MDDTHGDLPKEEEDEDRSNGLSAEDKAYDKGEDGEHGGKEWDHK